MISACRLQSRGPVQEAALYIARTADREVEAVLRSGGVCMVLGPPGSGKSSLRLRVGKTLSDAGVTGAHLPLGKLPSATPAAFCLGFMQGLGRTLGLPPLGPFFQRYAEQYGNTSPAERLETFLRDIVLHERKEPVALFFDDLDGLESECADTLLAALRSFYAQPPSGGDGEADASPRLGVCLTSAVDSDELSLVLPTAAKRIYLAPFSRAELAEFTPALLPLCQDRPESERDAAVSSLLDAVHEWTGGHPYLTQHLCQQLVARTGQSPRPELEAFIERLFPAGEVGDDEILLATERRLLQNRRATALLALWRRIWRGEAVHADFGDVAQRTLWLCGLITSPSGTDESRLRPLGRLHSRIFDDEWARRQEARQLLDIAVQEGEAAKLRGAALKTAQTWALRHPEAMTTVQVRALLLCLEAARQEAEARHQSSAAALQRETRERSELRNQWVRERDELTQTSEQAQKRLRVVGVLFLLLLLLSVYLGYRVFSKRSNSSPLCQMSPAPSVITKSFG